MSDPPTQPDPSAAVIAPARHPLKLAAAAARANLRPGIILWAFGALIVGCYFYLPAAHDLLTRLGGIKDRLGLAFSVPSTVLFAALIPYALQQLTPLKRPFNPKYLLFLVAFWAWKGAEVDLLYRLQAHLFGDNRAPATIAIKVFVDQFIYVTIWAAPTMAFPFFWAENTFRLGPVRRVLRGPWYRRIVVPILVPNWLVWIPAVALIYMLPLPLQLPIQNVILCMWSCMLLFIAYHNKNAGEPI